MVVSKRKVVLIILMLFSILFYFYKNNLRGDYDVIFSGMLNDNIAKFENTPFEDGMPKLKFNGENIDYPIQTFLIALTNYKHYKYNGDDKSLKLFLHLAETMRDRGEIRAYNNMDFLVWTTSNKLEGMYDLEENWVSSMSQGLGISTMLAAFQITGDKLYFDYASKAVNAYEIDRQNGGIKDNFGGFSWFDEYPVRPQKHVLNGYIFALQGLVDAYSFYGIEKARRIFRESIVSLKNRLPLYDLEYASLYSQSTDTSVINKLATLVGKRYQALHVGQLLWLYNVTGDDFFYNYAHKFLKQDFNESMFAYGLDNKILEVNASYSIDPDKFGVNHLSDTILTYGNYWSTNIFPTSLEIILNREVEGLDGVTIITTGAYITDISITYEKSGAIFDIDPQLIVEDTLKERHFLSRVHHYKFPAINGVDRFHIKFKGSNDKVLGVREINPHFDMTPELGYIEELMHGS